MHKGKSAFAIVLSLTLLNLSSACKPAVSLPVQEPPVSETRQAGSTAVPTEQPLLPDNYICGMVENRTDTGAFSPVMTIPASGQVIALDVLIDDMLTNYSSQLPSSFMIFDPVVTESQDLQGGTSLGLTGYSGYEQVNSCPASSAVPTQTIQPAAADIPLPIEIPILVMAWYPPNASNPEILDLQETGLSTNIEDLQAYVDQLAVEGARIASEGTRYHGYRDPDSPMYLQYSIFEKLEFFEPMPRGVPLDNSSFRPHYAEIFQEQQICDYVDTYGVREVWIYGYHSDTIVPDESKMSSLYGDISNAYPHDEDVEPQYRLPLCEHSYVMFNFNYGREIETNIHNRLHQIENVIFFTEDRGYPPDPDNVLGSLFWNDFSFWGNLDRRTGYRASCGNAHTAPNGTGDYVYASREIRENNCETWHPDDARTTYVMSDCSQWGCTEMGFYLWYMQNIPGYASGIEFRGTWMRNWWDAMADFNEFISGGQSLYTTDADSVVIPTADPSVINALPQGTPPPLNTTDHPVFEYPRDQQVLEYGGEYLFKVGPYKNADSYLWGFFQEGELVWENLRDEGALSGNSYNILTGSLAHALLYPGELEIWVRGLVDGEYSEAGVITIQLHSDDLPVFEYPQDQQVLDYGGDYIFKIEPYKDADQYLWGVFQDGDLIWENLRDEGTLSGTEYGIYRGTAAHPLLQPGEVKIRVSAWVDGRYSEAGVITILLEAP